MFFNMQNIIVIFDKKKIKPPKIIFLNYRRGLKAHMCAADRAWFSPNSKSQLQKRN